ncbi:MAG: Lipoprotein BsmA [Candidatus Erwinia impunctatus]|nr:Lipoprotein BsmA [Culicoides impunctatus]
MRLPGVIIGSLLLTGCTLLNGQPETPPPPASCARLISRAQALTLQPIGSVSAEVRGSPDDAQRLLNRKANQARASYYLIQLIDETAIPGVWYARALLYQATLSPSIPLSTSQQCEDTPH